MHKVALSTVAALFVATLSSQALAEEPALVPAQAPVAPDAQAADPATPKPSGVTFDIGTGIGVLGGQLVRDLSFTSVQSVFSVKVGVYFSQHVAANIGFEGGTGTMNNGFDKAYAYRVPVRVEYAVKDRFRGVYIDGGLSFVNALGAYTDSAEKEPATLDASSPVDVGMGAGVRAPIGSGALDVRLGMDAGQYKEIGVHTVNGSASGSVDPNAQATHYAFNLSLAYRFGSH